MDSLVNALRRSLLRQLAALYPENGGERARELCESSPPILCFLAEPWLERLKNDADLWKILENCAFLHLYARILDDVLDEDRQEDRTALLRFQPLFWKIAAELSSMAPQLGQAARSILDETVLAVEKESGNASYTLWGAKNGHLLLLPLFLSGDSQFLANAGPMLLESLGILQALDECRQGAAGPGARICHYIQASMERGLPDSLCRGGWRMLAARICLQATGILNFLSQKMRQG